MMSPQKNPAKQAELTAIAKEVDIREHLAAKGERYEPLSLEDALARIEKVEMQKVQFMVVIIVASKIG